MCSLPVGPSPCNQELEIMGTYFAGNKVCPFATSYFPYFNTLSDHKYYLPFYMHALLMLLLSQFYNVISKLSCYINGISNIFLSLSLFILPYMKMPHYYTFICIQCCCFFFLNEVMDVIYFEKER